MKSGTYAEDRSIYKKSKFFKEAAICRYLPSESLTSPFLAELLSIPRNSILLQSFTVSHGTKFCICMLILD